MKKDTKQIAKPKEETAASTSSVTTVKTSFGDIATIPGVKTKILRVLLIGTAPLIVHSFPARTRKAILDKHMGEASEGKQKKNPIANFQAARYISQEGWDGIPAGGVKAGIVAGFNKSTGVARSDATGAIRVKADGRDLNSNMDLVRLILPEEPPEIARLPHQINEQGRVPRCREDVVRNDTGVVDIRHRPEYSPWGLLTELLFDPSVVSERQLLQAIAVSGFRVGQCEWRPKSKKSLSGQMGTFGLATAEEIELFEKGDLFRDYDWSVAKQQFAEAAE